MSAVHQMLGDLLHLNQSDALAAALQLCATDRILGSLTLRTHGSLNIDIGSSRLCPPAHQ